MRQSTPPSPASRAVFDGCQNEGTGILQNHPYPQRSSLHPVYEKCEVISISEDSWVPFPGQVSYQESRSFIIHKL